MKESCRIKLERRLKNEAVKKASVKGDVPQVAVDLREGAPVYDYGMLADLRAEMGNQGKSLVSTLWCVVCWQYETRICGVKNFFRARTNCSSNHKTSNITDHANSKPHNAAMIYLRIFTCYCIYCTLLLYNVQWRI